LPGDEWEKVEMAGAIMVEVLEDLVDAKFD
jgi:hypothetical protein